MTKPNAEPVGEILTAKEVSLLLKVSLDQVYRLQLPKFRLGRRSVRYLREDVMNYVRTLSQPMRNVA